MSLSHRSEKRRLRSASVNGRRLDLFAATVMGVAVFVALLDQTTAPAPLTHHWLSLVPFFGLLVAAQILEVRFRFRGRVQEINLSLAIIAPLIFGFAGPVATSIILGAQLFAGLARRSSLVQLAIAAAHWSIAVALGSLIFSGMAGDPAPDGRTLSSLIVALIAIGVINQFAVGVIERLSTPNSDINVVRNLTQVVLPVWLRIWGLNTAMGLLFVFAYHASSYAVLLFIVPLWVLNAAYRGQASLETDHQRLDGLHEVSQLIATQTEGEDLIARTLDAICRAFDADRAELVLKHADGLLVSQVGRSGLSSYARTVDASTTNLRATLMKAERTTRITSTDDSVNACVLIAQGHQDCLMTPLPSREINPGYIAVYDQDGTDTNHRGEVSIIEALARDIAGTFEKGKLFATIVEERYKLSRIVDTTFDGVLTLSATGVVRSWNPGWEQITGVPSRDALGRPVGSVITIFELDGKEIDLSSWSATYEPLPNEVQLFDSLGNVHFLQCSYRAELADNSAEGLLIIVAHDKSDEREIEQLREDVDRLAELEAAQRASVLQIQESLQPNAPIVTEAEFGIFYQPSDTTAPTGGDFYDWQTLPGGDVHISVVDVLGSGIDATNDAFAVIHTLRTLAYQGIPVDQLIAETDNLLATLNPELVATVMCVRYNPRTGRIRLAGGGHPPALVVRQCGRVDEIAAPGIPVGWPGAGSEFPVDIQLESRDSLVLYTDGLIEAHRDILLGLAALQENAAEARNLAVNDLARVLVERSLEGAARRDDSLALVVRHCGVGLTSVKHQFAYRGRPEPQSVSAARHAMSEWIDNNNDVLVVSDDLAIIMSELATNSARLGISFFEVRVSLIDGGVVLEVEDDGPGFEYDPASPAAADSSEHGRGLLIARTLADDLVVRRTARGCMVRAVLRRTSDAISPADLDTTTAAPQHSVH